MTQSTPSPQKFQKVGLPEGHAYPELAYHLPTGSILAHTRPVEPGLPGRRLSLWRVAETRYHPIGDFALSISVESFVLHPQLPLLYFITYVWSEHSNGPTGGNWEALHCFNLNTFQCEIVARRGELIPPDDYCKAWLNELFLVGDDGNTLFCKAGLRNGEPVQYCLSKLSVSDRKLEIVSRLEAVFA